MALVPGRAVTYIQNSIVNAVVVLTNANTALFGAEIYCEVPLKLIDPGGVEVMLQPGPILQVMVGLSDHGALVL